MVRDVEIAALDRSLGSVAETVALDDAAADRWSVHGVRPRLACTPSTAEALALALAACDEAGAAVIPWGGGTQQRLGLPPRRADVILATRRLDRLVEHEPENLTVTVEAGMRFADLQAGLGLHGQWLPLDPPVSLDATIGGLVATNVSGPRRLKEGGLRDLVIGTRVANVDGTVTKAGGRVVKNVTGYDLNKLHIGALGTLGVVVEVTLKVAPRPVVERTWLGVFQTAETAAAAVGRLLRLPLAPTALDLLNDRAAGRAGLPVPPGHWALVGRAGGFQSPVARHIAELDAAARAVGAVETQVLGDGLTESFWSAYDETCAALRWSAGALTCRLAVPPAAIGPLCARIAGLGGEPTVWAHATGAVFWSVPAEAVGSQESAVLAFGGQEWEASRIAWALGPNYREASADTIVALRYLATDVGGGLVVESWPAKLAGIDVWGTPGGALVLMRAVKAQYDPRGTLNPGRFVGGI